MTPISLERANELFAYDPDTGDIRWRVDRHYQVKAGQIAGYISDGYRKIRTNRKDIFAHRLAWFIYYGRWPKIVDHINGVRSDNRICNLRECTAAQNVCNSKIYSNNRSGLKGVRMLPGGKAFQATVRSGGKYFYLGCFPTAEQAHDARLKAATVLHGEFVREK